MGGGGNIFIFMYWQVLNESKLVNTQDAKKEMEAIINGVQSCLLDIKLDNRVSELVFSRR